jgi:hypothetical protein
MDLLLSLGNKNRTTGARATIANTEARLCLGRLPSHYAFWPRFHLVLRDFNQQPVVFLLQSAAEIEIDTNGNRLEVWNNVFPTLAYISRLQELVLSKSGCTTPQPLTLPPFVTFLRLVNSTSKPVIIAEDLYSMAFWLPPGETVTFDCRIQSFSCGFYFTEPHAGHPTFIVGDCYSLEVSYFPYPYKKKVEEWGTPDGFRKWDYRECIW